MRYITLLTRQHREAKTGIIEPMSDQPDRSPTDSALRTRVLVAGIFLGALGAMSLSWVFSWVPESPRVIEQREVERQEEQIVKQREEAFRSPPGSCLTWTKQDASDVHKVACDAEHLFEVVGIADISTEYGPKAPIPDTGGWRELTEKHCGELVEDYLDKPLDPEGKLTIGMLRPDNTQWDEGDRTLHCGLQWVGPGGGLQTLTEPAAEMNQSYVWEPGTCLGLVDKTVGDPVSCSEPHSYEIVGLVDLRDEFDEFPSEEDQHEWLDPTCAEIVKKYTDGKDVAELADDGLVLTWDLRTKESWEAGSALVNCKVGAVLEDDSGLAPVQGSVKDEPEEKSGEKKPEEEKSGDGESGDTSGSESGDTSGDGGTGSGDADTGGGTENNGTGNNGTGQNDGGQNGGGQNDTADGDGTSTAPSRNSGPADGG